MFSSIDIAKKAGVSQSTVSRVMNNPDIVNVKTRNKVLHIMEELNYRPNSTARSLVKQKTYSIALISGPLHNPFFVETTTSIVNYAKSKGFNVNVHFENMGNNMAVYQDVLNHQVDGIILSSILYEDDIYEELQKLNIPYIMFNRRHKNSLNYVEMDNVQAGKLATNHLIDLNHREIVWIGGPLSMTTFAGRYNGFRQSFAENNVYFNEDNVIITDTSAATISAEVVAIMNRKNPPTAIFAATDSIAIYVMDTLKREGYQIPEDISLIGIDNVELSRHSAIDLSTVGIMHEENLGKIAIEHLIHLIEEKETCLVDVDKTIDTELFIRETTAKI